MNIEKLSFCGLLTHIKLAHISQYLNPIVVVLKNEFHRSSSECVYQDTETSLTRSQCFPLLVEDTANTQTIDSVLVSLQGR